MAEPAAETAPRDFSFAGSGGALLSGVIDAPEGEAIGFALFAHCFTCTKSSLAAVRVSRALAKRGIGTLRFDFTGLGRSEGDFAETDFSSNVGDLAAAAAAMAKAGMAPQLLIGHSLGGAAVIAAASAIDGVAAVATIGAPFDVGHVQRLFADQTGEIEQEGEAEVEIGRHQVTIGRGFLEDIAEHDQGEAIAALSSPLLIFHSPDDAVVGLDQAGRIYAAASHPKSFVALDGADHLLTNGRDAAFVADLIATWATRYLQPAGSAG